MVTQVDIREPEIVDLDVDLFLRLDSLKSLDLDLMCNGPKLNPNPIQT